MSDVVQDRHLASVQDRHLAIVQDRRLAIVQDQCLAIVKDQCRALSGQIEVLATVKQTAKVSSKRKRSNSPAGRVGFEEESSASSTLTGRATESPPEANGDYQRYLTKHHLSTLPKDMSNSAHVHYCELGLICCSLHRSRYHSYPQLHSRTKLHS